MKRMTFLAAAVVLFEFSIPVWGDITAQIVETPLFAYQYDLAVQAGQNGQTASVPWTDVNQAVLSVPIQASAEYGTFGQVSSFSLTLNSQTGSNSGSQNAWAMLSLGLTASASAQGYSYYDPNTEQYVQVSASYSVTTRLGTLPACYDPLAANWWEHWVEGVYPEALTVRFLASGSGAQISPGEPIVIRPYEASTLSYQANWAHVQGQTGVATFMSRRPYEVDARHDYGGDCAGWGYGGGMIGPPLWEWRTGGSPFGSPPMLGQLGDPNDLTHPYNNMASLAGYISTGISGASNSNTLSFVDVDVQMGLGMIAEVAQPVARTLIGHNSSGQPISGAPVVHSYTQHVDPNGQQVGDCAETSSAMIVDYWKQKLLGQSYQPIAEGEVDKIDTLRLDLRNSLPPWLIDHYVPGKSSPGVICDMLNYYFARHGMNLVANQIMPTNPETFFQNVGPAMVILERDSGGGMHARHAVVVDGYANYCDQFDDTDSTFISVKDTWGDGRTDIGQTGDGRMWSWVDGYGTEWWPDPSKNTPYQGSYPYRFDAIVTVWQAADRHERLHDSFDKPDDECYVPQGAASTNFGTWPGSPDPNNLALHMTSSDGTGRVLFSSALANKIFMQFDYLLEGDATVSLKLNDILLASINQAGPGRFSQEIDLTALGIAPDVGDFSLQFDGEGTPSLWIDNLGITAAPDLWGDTNGDGLVDMLDLNNVFNNLGQAGIDIPGDTNYDGVVDVLDLNNVFNNLGLTGPAAGEVPEPVTLTLLVLAGLGMLRRRK